MKDGVEHWALPTQHLGKQIQIHDLLDSTNARALTLAIDLSWHGTVIVARQQSAGRGQYGRTWQCPPNRGILMSLILFPPSILRQPAVMTALAAVAVAETIQETAGIQAQIKWPNDVLVSGRKISGILIEQSKAIVIGIGLNVNHSEFEFQAMGLPDATSLAVQTGHDLDIRQLLKALIVQLDREYHHLVSGDRTSLEARWRERLGLLGQRVKLEKMDGSFLTGHLRKISFDILVLVDFAGTEHCLPPERIRHLFPLNQSVE